MTNQQIIMVEKAKLVEQGIIPENSELHTFATWKSLGFKVKKGEKAVAKFPVWKYVVKKVDVSDSSEEDSSEDADEKPKSRMIMKTAAFFTNSQVEKFEQK